MRILSCTCSFQFSDVISYDTQTIISRKLLINSQIPSFKSTKIIQHTGGEVQLKARPCYKMLHSNSLTKWYVIILRYQVYRFTLYLSWTTIESITTQNQWSRAWTSCYIKPFWLLLYDVITLPANRPMLHPTLVSCLYKSKTLEVVPSIIDRLRTTESNNRAIP